MPKKSPEADVIPAQSPAKNPRYTKWFLVIFFMIGFVLGLRNIWHWEPSKLDIILPVAFAINGLWWVIADARHRGHPIPLLAKPFFLLLSGFMLPGYIIWTRGWRGLGWMVLVLIIWYAMGFAVSYAGWHIMYGEELPNGISET